MLPQKRRCFSKTGILDYLGDGEAVTLMTVSAAHLSLPFCLFYRSSSVRIRIRAFSVAVPSS